MAIDSELQKLMDLHRFLGFDFLDYFYFSARASKVIQLGVDTREDRGCVAETLNLLSISAMLGGSNGVVKCQYFTVNGVIETCFCISF